MQENVVLFPAPLGPSSPTISPPRTSKETPSTAVFFPNRLTRPSTCRTGISVYASATLRFPAHANQYHGTAASGASAHAEIAIP